LRRSRKPPINRQPEVPVAKRYSRPSPQYRYEHYDPKG